MCEEQKKKELIIACLVKRETLIIGLKINAFSKLLVSCFYLFTYFWQSFNGVNLTYIHLSNRKIIQVPYSCLHWQDIKLKIPLFFYPPEISRS